MSSSESLAEALLRPKSIAIVGATDVPGKRGRLAIESLRTFGYDGIIVPVNPNRKTVLDLPCYPSLSALPSAPDVALLAVPAAVAARTVEEADSAGVGACVVLGVGFRETGEVGALLEASMHAAIRDGSTRIIGPNTNGYVSSHTGVNVTGASDIPVGRIGLITQSGNVALEVWERLRRLGDGVGLYIGLGNKMDIGFSEVLSSVIPESGVDALVLHLEDLSEGWRLLDTLENLSPSFPIVAVVGGITARGGTIATTHTGAAASGTGTVVQLLEGAGVLVAETPRAAADLAVGLRGRTAAKGPVLVVSDGGGHAAIAADVLSRRTVPFVEIDGSTQRRLGSLLPNSATLRNPIDVAGATDEDPDVFRAVADAVLSNAKVSAVVLSGIIGGYGHRFANPDLTQREIDTAHQLAAVTHEVGVDLLVHTPFFESSNPVAAALRESGAAVYENIDDLASVLAFEQPSRTIAQPRGSAIGEDVAHCNLAALDSVRSMVEEIPEDVARRFLVSHGIVTSEWIVAELEEIPAICAGFDYPLAMKAVGWNAGHKSDWGGVVLNVGSDTMVSETAARLADSGRLYEASSSFRPTGILVTPQFFGDAEVLVGATRHTLFGPLTIIGPGGRMADALGDPVMRRGLVSRRGAEEMVLQSPLAKVAQSGRVTSDVTAELAALLHRISKLIVSHPFIDAIDLNPVLITQEGLKIVDVKMTVWASLDGRETPHGIRT